MRLTFTESKDGELRATVRVPFRVGRDEIIAAIAHRIIHDNYDIAAEDDLQYTPGSLIVDMRPFKNKTSVIKALIYAYNIYGQDAVSYWSDGVEGKEIDLIRIFATTTADKLFPELKPK